MNDQYWKEFSYSLITWRITSTQKGLFCSQTKCFMAFSNPQWLVCVLCLGFSSVCCTLLLKRPFLKIIEHRRHIISILTLTCPRTNQSGESVFTGLVALLPPRAGWQTRGWGHYPRCVTRYKSDEGAIFRSHYSQHPDQTKPNLVLTCYIYKQPLHRPVKTTNIMSHGPAYTWRYE